MVPIIPALLPLAEQAGRRLPAHRGLHRRIRGRLAHGARQHDPVARRRLARGRHHRHDGGRGRLRAADEAAGGRGDRCVGISASLAGRLSSNFGTMTSAACVRRGANGIMAAMLAQRGFTRQRGRARGHQRLLPRLRAWARHDVRAVPRSRPDLRHRRARLPAEALSMRRPRPTAIDATLELRDTLLPRLDDIEGVAASIKRYAGSTSGRGNRSRSRTRRPRHAVRRGLSLIHAPDAGGDRRRSDDEDGGGAHAARLVSIATIDPGVGKSSREPSRIIVREGCRNDSSVGRMRY